MPTLTITKTYVNGNILTQSDLDTAFDSISTFLNTTKIDSNNVQTGGLIGTNIASGSITVVQMGANSVGSSQLTSSAITTAAIGPLAVTRAQQMTLGEQLSSIASTASTSVTGYLDVPGLSVSLTTSGRPVFLGIVAAGSSGQKAGFQIGNFSSTGASNTSLAYTRDGSRLGEYGIFAQASGGAGSISYQVNFPYHIDQPSAGSYTYAVQTGGGSNETRIMRQCKLVAFEL